MNRSSPRTEYLGTPAEILNRLEGDCYKKSLKIPKGGNQNPP